MRLTLRTLLAYMDDILDPADKEELAKKIESSDFAEDLIHRTRDVTRRLRRSAPQVVGTGMGLDPNTVAEYLDNVLPPDSVGDFERICLESDVHLAEVASCHHVLTMVLGEPADVDPTSRQRMYQVLTEAEQGKRLRIEGAHGSPDGGQRPLGDDLAADVLADGARRSADQSLALEVPEYLRAARRSRYRIALFAGLAAVLLIGATLLLVPGTRGWLFGGSGSSDLAANQSATNADDSIPVPPGVIPDSDTAGTEPLQAPRDATRPEETDLAAGRREPGDSVAAAPGSGMDNGPGMGDGSGERTQQQPLPGTLPRPDATSSDAANDAIPGAEPLQIPADGQTALPQNTRTELEAHTETVPVPSDVPLKDWPVTPNEMGGFPGEGAAGMPTVTPTEGDTRIAARTGDLTRTLPPPGGGIPDTVPGEAAADAAPVAGLGTYRDGQTVLLRYRDDERAWYRIEPRTTIRAGDRLLALPEFRPEVALAAGIDLVLSGGTLIHVKTADAVSGEGLLPDAADVPVIDVLYGRVVLLNQGQNDRRVRLSFGATAAEVILAGGASFGIEVERKYVAGHDPRRTPAPMIVQLFAPQGNIRWLDAAGPRTIEQPEHWSITDDVSTEAVALETPPVWFDHEPNITPSQQLYGAPALEESLTTDRPAGVQLMEVFHENRRIEVRSLAAKSSIHVGQFVPFVAALRDSKQRPNWQTHIASLRAAMALSNESAERIWQTLVEQRGGRAAADLYEMLCGYDLDQVGRTREEVQHGALARLIQWLDSDNLDYRVLAVENLAEITGKRLLSNPDGSATERARGFREWRERLESGELVPEVEQ